MTKLEKDFELNRTPKDYEVTSHLRRRLNERGVLEEDMVADTISDGEVVEVNDNPEGDSRTNAVIRHTWLMTTLEVVVGVEEEKVQTAYEVEG